MDTPPAPAAVPAGADSPLAAWPRLLRLPLLPTAATNALAGFLLRHDSADDLPFAFLFLAMASAVLLLAGGLALNDFFDREEDRRLRPERPLAAGQVRPATAAGLGLGLLALSLVPAALLGGRALTVACLLLALVLAYNSCLKRFWPLGVVALGLCRALAVLLGWVARGEVRADHLLAPPFIDPPGGLWLDGRWWLVPGIYGLYTVALSLISRAEKRPWPSWALFGPVTLLLLACLMLAVPFQPLSSRDLPLYSLGILFVFLAHRGARALREPTPANCRRLAGAALCGFLFLDAAVAIGCGFLPAALLIIALLPVSLFLHKHFSAA